jgi:hypothetical protein
LFSGHSSCLQIQRTGFDSRRYQIFWEVMGLERGPLSLVSAIEELFAIKSSSSGLENREYRCRDPSRWPRGIHYPHKLALTSPTSGGRSGRDPEPVWTFRKKEKSCSCRDSNPHNPAQSQSLYRTNYSDSLQTNVALRKIEITFLNWQKQLIGLDQALSNQLLSVTSGLTGLAKHLFDLTTLN